MNLPQQFAVRNPHLAAMFAKIEEFTEEELTAFKEWWTGTVKNFKDYFENHPKADEFHFTSDGMCFTDQKLAVDHMLLKVEKDKGFNKGITTVQRPELSDLGDQNLEAATAAPSDPPPPVVPIPPVTPAPPADPAGNEKSSANPPADPKQDPVKQEKPADPKAGDQKK